MNATAQAEREHLVAAQPSQPGALELVPVAQSGPPQLAPSAEAANDSPFALAMRAVERGMSLEMVERMLAVQERWEASQARKAYFDAFASFRKESIKVVRNVERTSGPLKGTFYADLFAVVDAITAHLSKYRLSHSWQITRDEPEWIEVTCSLRHALGYSESVSMGGPPDTADAKNPIQRRASTIKYLERYTLQAITGVAEQNDPDDDDGNGGKGNQPRQPTPRRTPGTPPPDAVPATAAEAAAAAAQGAAEGPFYPQADFDKHFPDWEKAIKNGKQTPYRVIAKLETHMPLSQEQKRLIRACAA